MPKKIPMLELQQDGFNVEVQCPLVVRISDMAAHQLRCMNSRLTPEALGYRLVAREPWWRVGLYARPWVLWALLRGVENWKAAYWGGIWWLYDKHIIHLASRDGSEFRWRDVRLGRGADA